MNNFDSIKLISLIANYCRKQLPSNEEFAEAISVFVKILFGALLLAPIINILPMLGFDWFYFFNCGNPKHCLNSTLSTYPPFANLILQLFTWMEWRNSLAILNSITLVSIAIGTWRAGGRYGAIFLALFNAPVLFLLWIGHPDSIPLVGVLTGFTPFILVKPPIAIWSVFSSRRKMFWTAFLLIASMFIWPMWFLNLGKATPLSNPAFGWPVTGWPILIIGILLFIGARNEPFRLMAAGTMITPYLLPYHLAILAPGIGSAKGYRKFIVWIAAWLVAIGTGLGSPYQIISFLFPLAIYFGNYSPSEVFQGIKERYLSCLTFTQSFVSNKFPTNVPVK